MGYLLVVDVVHSYPLVAGMLVYHSLPKKVEANQKYLRIVKLIGCHSDVFKLAGLLLRVLDIMSSDVHPKMLTPLGGTIV